MQEHKYGAATGLIVGGIMVFAWKFGISTLSGAFAIYELLPPFVAAFIAIIVVSLLTPAPEKEVIEEFDNVRKNVNS